jgi:hypothetical protein
MPPEIGRVGGNVLRPRHPTITDLSSAPTGIQHLSRAGPVSVPAASPSRVGRYPSWTRERPDHSGRSLLALLRLAVVHHLACRLQLAIRGQHAAQRRRRLNSQLLE